MTTLSSHGQNVGYVRVSSAEQNIARQLDGIELNKVFADKCSGGSTDRPALKQCLEYLREGDTLHVHSIDRLARNLADLQSIVNGLDAKGVCVFFHKENLVFDSSNAMSKLMFQMLGAFAEFERAMINSRRLEGQQKAREAGKHMGRKSNITKEQLAEIKARREKGETLSTIGKEYHVSATTILNQLRALESKSV